MAQATQSDGGRESSKTMVSMCQQNHKKSVLSPTLFFFALWYILWSFLKSLERTAAFFFAFQFFSVSLLAMRRLFFPLRGSRQIKTPQPSFPQLSFAAAVLSTRRLHYWDFKTFTLNWFKSYGVSPGYHLHYSFLWPVSPGLSRIKFSNLSPLWWSFRNHTSRRFYCELSQFSHAIFACNEMSISMTEFSSGEEGFSQVFQQEQAGSHKVHKSHGNRERRN